MNPLTKQEELELTKELAALTVQHVYTPQTLREIEEGRTFETTRRAQEEQRVEHIRQQAEGRGCQGLIELYDELEKRALQDIDFKGAEIGLMVSLKEIFKNNTRIQAYCHYFINLHTCEIEELYDDVEEYRQFKKRLEKLPG
jgi:hypothetical protein